MRSRARAPLGSLILATLTACTPSEPPPAISAPTPIDADLRPVTIREPRDHWESEGYIELVPAVRLPTTDDGEDRIRVFAKLPETGRIRVDWLAVQGRHTVHLPEGAVVDRVESWKYREPSGDVKETVVDVRGVRMTQAGPRYHVLRPASDAPTAPLLGWSWPAADDAAHAEATLRLEQFLRGRPNPVTRAPLGEEQIADIVENNACGSCHVGDRASDVDRDSGPRRATDADGNFALLMVLEREMPISTARPHDLNHRDPFVQLRCTDGTELVSFTPMPRCAGDESPLAVRDVRAGMTAGDAYTVRLCESRKYLWDHMDGTAREAFADAFRECGLVVESPTLARSAS